MNYEIDEEKMTSEQELDWKKILLGEWRKKHKYDGFLDWPGLIVGIIFLFILGVVIAAIIKWAFQVIF